jgi:hypothetical protein
VDGTRPFPRVKTHDASSGHHEIRNDSGGCQGHPAADNGLVSVETFMPPDGRSVQLPFICP